MGGSEEKIRRELFLKKLKIEKPKRQFVICENEIEDEKTKPKRQFVAYENEKK